MRKILNLAIVIAIFARPETGLASLNACSFYNEPKLASNFWSCAEPEVLKRSCTIIRGVCPACVKYKGDKGKMYMPDFFVEVTSKFGESAFIDMNGKNVKPASLALRKHLDLAKEPYKDGASRFFPDFSYDADTSDEGNSHFWHVRIIQPSRGTIAFAYLDMPFTGVVTAALPTCFQGISEFLKEQWVYNRADLPFAAAWAPLGLRVCNSGVTLTASEISSAISKATNSSNEILGGFQTPGIPLVNCAFPLGAKAMLVRNLIPSSDALSPTKLCMENFGNLIPRDGHQDTEDPFISAVQAAWKFLSLVKDMHPHTGVSIESNHKWQLVYPPADSLSAKCFNPGTFTRGHFLTPLGPRELQGLGSDSYIFAIWRPRKTTVCYEPGTANVLWKKRIKNIDHKALKSACKAISL